MEEPKCRLCGEKHWPRAGCAAFKVSKPMEKGASRRQAMSTAGGKPRGLSQPSPPSDRKAYLRAYMREYMRKRRSK